MTRRQFELIFAALCYYETVIDDHGTGSDQALFNRTVAALLDAKPVLLRQPSRTSRPAR